MITKKQFMEMTNSEVVENLTDIYLSSERMILITDMEDFNEVMEDSYSPIQLAIQVYFGIDYKSNNPFRPMSDFFILTEEDVLTSIKAADVKEFLIEKGIERYLQDDNEKEELFKGIVNQFNDELGLFGKGLAENIIEIMENDDNLDMKEIKEYADVLVDNVFLVFDYHDCIEEIETADILGTVIYGIKNNKLKYVFDDSEEFADWYLDKINVPMSVKNNVDKETLAEELLNNYYSDERNMYSYEGGYLRMGQGGIFVDKL